MKLCKISSGTNIACTVDLTLCVVMLNIGAIATELYTPQFLHVLWHCIPIQSQ